MWQKKKADSFLYPLKVITLMELTLNNAHYSVENNMGWNLPQFGFQKFVAVTSESIFDTIHRSFDYKGKSTTRELIIFSVFFVLMQAVLIPTESYTTLHANLSMMVAAAVTDLVACVIPAVALVVRWMK